VEEYLYRHFFRVENDHWWFAARQVILTRYLERRVPPSPAVRLLDVGCGTGAILARLSALYDVHGSDESPHAIEHCRKRGLTKLFTGPLEAYPPSAPFDIVTLLDVIEHADDDVGLLREAGARLGPGGHVLVTVPAYPSLWSVHDVVTHHKRRYTRASLVRAVTAAGFAVRDMNYFNTLLFPLALAARLSAQILNKQEAGDFAIPPGPVNSALKSVFEAEQHLVPTVTLPFGLSLLCWAERAAR
jgi:SAM-dependent methyltransferase